MNFDFLSAVISSADTSPAPISSAIARLVARVFAVDIIVWSETLSFPRSDREHKASDSTLLPFGSDARMQ